MMANNLLKDLQKIFKEVDHENIRLWCETLGAVEIYDTPEHCEILATECVEQIENQATTAKDTLGSVELANPTIVAGTVKQSVDELALTRREQVLDALQTVASTVAEEQKVDVLLKTNAAANPSIVEAIQQRYWPQTGAIPMIFAVFSRKNDYYGLGSQGTDTSSSSNW
jgi:hypothetical protein